MVVGPADYNSSPAGIADGRRLATALTRRARAGSAATSLVRLLRLAAAAWPGLSWPAPAAAATGSHGACTSQVPTGGPRSAGKKRQPTGPARNQHARGPDSRPCAGQVASARPWAGAATCKRVETPSPASRLDRVRRRSGCNDSRPDRFKSAGRYLLRYQRSAAARPVSRTTTVTSCDGACAQNHEDALTQVWVTAVMLAWLSSGQSRVPSADWRDVVGGGEAVETF